IDDVFPSGYEFNPTQEHLDDALMTAAVAETTGMHRVTVSSSSTKEDIPSPFQTLNRRYP
ncbi:MAG: hypothetical protein L7U53_02285, partial [Candidatus Poseidoniaceae archaeon]|nr:hypothetical protein [Candidatus Poseidoniaceae archaeon]